MDNFEDFLDKMVRGELDFTFIDMEKKMEELNESLRAFIPDDIETTWDMAVIEYGAWAKLWALVPPELGAMMELILNLKSTVFVSYWLGRRDERLEGMLGEVDVDSD